MSKLPAEEKEKELVKFTDLILATLSYLHIKSPETVTESYVESLKMQVLGHLGKGRLTKLKQWFQDLSEWPREADGKGFDTFLIEQTGYHVDGHVDFEVRIKAILTRDEIKNEAEFRDVLSKVDQLCSTGINDQSEINKLNSLLLNFEKR